MRDSRYAVSLSNGPRSMSSSKSLPCQVSDGERHSPMVKLPAASWKSEPILSKRSRDSCRVMAPSWLMTLCLSSSDSGRVLSLKLYFTGIL